MLPFLKNKTWPRIGKPVGVSKYGFSEDDDLIDEALDALMASLAVKDRQSIVSAIEALISLIRNKYAQSSEEA